MYLVVWSMLSTGVSLLVVIDTKDYCEYRRHRVDTHLERISIFCVPISRVPGNAVFMYVGFVISSLFFPG